jgi:peptidoglycan hydrolase CwlO-like protein
MEKIVITEEQVKKILDNVLAEEMTRVSRQDFSRTQFKIEELQNSLNETIKEFRKLQNSIPNGLQTTTNSKISSIASSLGNIQRDINKLKEGVRTYKRKMYAPPPITPEV